MRQQAPTVGPGHASACRVGTRIDADAHVPRQLRVGPAVVTPDMFEHYPPLKPLGVVARSQYITVARRCNRNKLLPEAMSAMGDAHDAITIGSGLGGSAVTASHLRPRFCGGASRVQAPAEG